MKVEEIRKLQQRKYREQFGCFLAEGEHLVQELQQAALRDARLRASQVYFTPEYANWASPLAMHPVSARQMAQLSETRTPQGIAAVVPLLAPPPAQPGERAIYLHELQDPGNLGSILRTLAWFGNFRCLLGPNSVDLYNGKAVRASMGAIFRVPVETDVPLAALPARFRRIACLDLQGRPITDPAFHECDCHVFGNEGRGLPQAALAGLAAERFTIAGHGAVESLNIATSVAICQYEASRPAT